MLIARSERPALLPSLRSVADIVDRLFPAWGTRPAIRYDDGQTYVTLGFDEYLRNTRRMIAFLAADADRPRVIATFVKNRPEWDMVALATFYCGCILFPLDTTFNDDELKRLLLTSPPDDVLVGRSNIGRLRGILSELRQRPRLLFADAFHVQADEGAEATQEDLVRLSTLQHVPELATLRPSARLNNPDTILAHYATSGTVSLPKVVQITHGNILAQLVEALDVIQLRPHEDVLNIGSYTHIATLLEFLVTKIRGFTVTYCTRDVESDGVLEAEINRLKALGVRIRVLMAVPKFWVFLMKDILEEMKNKPVWHGLYRHLAAVERHASVTDLGTLDKAKLSALRVFVRNKMGGAFSFGISSSSRLDPGIAEVFARLGITLIDIYGATEASGIIARSRLNESRRGSCGRLIEGLEYKIHDPRNVPGIHRPVGELFIRGGTISPGYVGEGNSGHVDSEGFYRSGDLAWVDEDRWVWLVGRRKELLLCHDGTFVDPMHVSNLLVRSVWIKDALVTRLNEDHELSVFVQPDWKRIEKDAGYLERVRMGVSREQAVRPLLDSAVAAAEEISATTALLSRERIYILKQPLERTPTHKVKLVRELERLDRSNWL